MYGVGQGWRLADMEGKSSTSDSDSVSYLDGIKSTFTGCIGTGTNACQPNAARSCWKATAEMESDSASAPEEFEFELTTEQKSAQQTIEQAETAAMLIKLRDVAPAPLVAKYGKVRAVDQISFALYASYTLCFVYFVGTPSTLTLALALSLSLTITPTL